VRLNLWKNFPAAVSEQQHCDTLLRIKCNTGPIWRKLAGSILERPSRQVTGSCPHLIPSDWTRNGFIASLGPDSFLGLQFKPVIKTGLFS